MISYLAMLVLNAAHLYSSLILISLRILNFETNLQLGKKTIYNLGNKLNNKPFWVVFLTAEKQNSDTGLMRFWASLKELPNDLAWVRGKDRVENLILNLIMCPN